MSTANEQAPVTLQDLQDRLQAQMAELQRANERLKEEIEVGRRIKQRLEEANDRIQKNQSQLVQSEKKASLGQLAAGVAHEINNPVGFVMSNLSSLTQYVAVFRGLLSAYEKAGAAIEGGRISEAQESLAQVAAISEKEDLAFVLEDVGHLLAESVDGMQRIKEIVQGLKSFARVDEAKLKESNINDGIEATLKVIWNELKYKCEVKKNLAPLPAIRCYPGQLNQVFMNLLINAAQAIPERGTITITSEATDKDIVICISDTGQGIPPENLSKLFTPFFTTKPVGKGTGLGLSISYGVVQKHNGTIGVVSQMGQGTTFTIRLPLSGVEHE